MQKYFSSFPGVICLIELLERKKFVPVTEGSFLKNQRQSLFWRKETTSLYDSIL
jgi:hypothetical protein